MERLAQYKKHENKSSECYNFELLLIMKFIELLKEFKIMYSWDFDGTFFYDESPNMPEVDRIAYYATFIILLVEMSGENLHTYINTARYFDEMRKIADEAKKLFKDTPENRKILNTAFEEIKDNSLVGNFFKNMNTNDLDKYIKACDSFIERIGVFGEGLMVGPIPELEPEKEDILQEYIRENNFYLYTNEQNKRFIITIPEKEIENLQKNIEEIHQYFKEKIVISTSGKYDQTKKKFVNHDTKSINWLAKYIRVTKKESQHKFPGAGYGITMAAIKGREVDGRPIGAYVVLDTGVSKEELIKMAKELGITVRGNAGVDEGLGNTKPIHLVLEGVDKSKGQKVMREIQEIIYGTLIIIFHAGNNPGADNTPHCIITGKYGLPEGGPRFVFELLTDEVSLTKEQSRLKTQN